MSLILADSSPVYRPYYRLDRPGKTYTIYGYTTKYNDPSTIWSRTRVFALNEAPPPAFDKVVLRTRIWQTWGACPYYIWTETIGTTTNAHDTGERSTYTGGVGGYSFEITKHKLIDDQTSKVAPPAPRVAPGAFYTSLYNGQDTRDRFRGAGGGCGTLPVPTAPGGGGSGGDGDDDDGETG